MRVPGNAKLLDVWEQGLALEQIQGANSQIALLLLAAYNPGAAMESLAEMPIGRRDGLLLTLREQTFGSSLVGLVSCPNHGGSLELDFNVQDIRAEEVVELDGRGAEPMTLAFNGYEVTYRLPNSADIVAIAAKESVEKAQEALLAHCLVEIKQQGTRLSPDSMPEGDYEKVAAALAAEMEKQDPQANTRLAIVCPECGYEWEMDFDIVPFFWAEIKAWAQRTLHEVHVLASTYGWSEREILALGPKRRQHYLEVINR